MTDTNEAEKYAEDLFTKNGMTQLFETNWFEMVSNAFDAGRASREEYLNEVVAKLCAADAIASEWKSRALAAEAALANSPAGEKIFELQRKLLAAEAESLEQARLLGMGAEREHVHLDECEQCGGDGVTGHYCGEDTCCCADPEDNVTCTRCCGTGWT